VVKLKAPSEEFSAFDDNAGKPWEPDTQFSKHKI
jgi:hypothetical protein